MCFEFGNHLKRISKNLSPFLHRDGGHMAIWIAQKLPRAISYLRNKVNTGIISAEQVCLWVVYPSLKSAISAPEQPYTAQISPASLSRLPKRGISTSRLI
jgi:hypothetical protein